MDDDWFCWKRTPERAYIIRESTDRLYRYSVWYCINNVPLSLRDKYYSTLPNYLVDKVRDRVKVIEKKLKRKI